MADETKKAGSNAATEQEGAGKATNKANDESGALGSAESRKASAATGKVAEKAATENEQAGGVPQAAGGPGPDKSTADVIAGLNAQISTLQFDLNSANAELDIANQENEKLQGKLNQPSESQPGNDPDEQEELDADISSIDFRVRGLLMSIIIKLPAAARYRSDVDQLDQMVQFVNEYETADERIVAVELIKALGAVDLNKIASGSYKTDVHVAMAAIRGETFSVEDIRSPESQQAAADRMQMAFSGGRLPEIPEAARRDLEESTKPRRDPAATAEQNAAADRLYGASGKK